MSLMRRARTRDLDAETLALANAMAATTASAAVPGGGLVPPPNGSWEQPNWFISPQTGDDANSGLSSSAPLKTYRRLTGLWQTVSPLLPQATVIQFLTSHTDNSDPVICKPYTTGQSSYCVIRGTRTLVATGTLSGVVPKNRSTPQLLEATLAAGLSPNMLIVNTTHPSEATLYELVSGTTWKISQPITVATIPPTLVQNEVNTWADGDTYEVYSVTNVNVAEFSPTILDVNDVTFNNISLLDDLVVWDPASFDECYTRGGTTIAQNVVFQRHLTYDGQSNGEVLAFLQNCSFPFGCLIAGSDISTIKVMGGICGNSGTPPTFRGCTLDFDVILAEATPFLTQSNTFGAVYLETGTTMKLFNADLEYEHATIASDAIWGPGAIEIRRSSLVLEPGVGVGEATLLLKGGITLDGSTTAYSISGSTLNPGIAITAANLDAAAGPAGFGGLAVSFAGSQIFVDPNVA